MPDGQSKNVGEQEQTLKNVGCCKLRWFCPSGGQVDDGQAVKVTTRDHPLLKRCVVHEGSFCSKIIYSPQRGFYILQNESGLSGLKGNRQRVSWEESYGWCKAQSCKM